MAEPISTETTNPVYLRAERLPVTKDKEKAKRARKLVYYGFSCRGDGMVDCEGEYIVLEPGQIKSVLN